MLGDRDVLSNRAIEGDGIGCGLDKAVLCDQKVSVVLARKEA